jgi:predicted O-methyltransferase YrrM
VTERTRRIARLAVGVFIPHTLVVLVRSRRARHRRERLGGYPPAAERAARAFDHEAAVALLVERGVPKDVATLGSVPLASMDLAGEQVARHARPGPLRVLHVGNFLGLSLVALSDTAVRHHPDSVVVSIDPNLTHLEVEDPQDHVLALLTEFGLQNACAVICGYSLEGSARGPAGENTLGSLERLGQRFDVAMVDGNHDPDYLSREIEAITRLLDDGGLLVIDDVSGAYPEVRALFDRLVDDPAWPFERLALDDRLGVLRKTAG